MTDDRCPSCSAHVTTGAQWCGQCYTSLIREPVRPARGQLTSGAALQILADDGGSVAVADLPPVPPPPPGGTIPPPPAPPGTPPAALRLGKQPWPCSRCETVNAFDDNTCKACGLRFLDGLDDTGASIPFFGSIDGLSRGGKIKIVSAVSGTVLLILLVIFTVAGFIFG